LISRYGRRGLASAVVEGAMATFAPVVAVIDADMQHDERVLPRLFELVHSGEKDVAIGSRYCADGGCGEWAESRKKASQLATRVANAFLPEGVSDPMSGLFAIRRDLVVEALPGLSQMGFKILLDLLMTSPAALRVGEVPYTFRTREVGESKLDGTVIVDFAMLLLDKKIGRWISPRLIFFGAIGALGLVVHLAILSICLKLFGTSFPVGQTAAVAGAIAFNFILNNELTYRDRRLRGWKMVGGLVSFYAICSLGAVANVGAGSLAFANQYSWWVAGIAGAIVGSAWNFMASRMLTWRK
jgi:dolichol-phosphate mannosyltransferase